MGAEYHFDESGPNKVLEPSGEIVARVVELGAQVLFARRQLEEAQAKLSAAEEAAATYVTEHSAEGAMLVPYCLEQNTFAFKASQAAVPIGY